MNAYSQQSNHSQIAVMTVARQSYSHTVIPLYIRGDYVTVDGGSLAEQYHTPKPNPMKSDFHFLVEIPQAGIALTWIGGGLKPSKKPGHVWLTTPRGDPVLEVPRNQVHPTTLHETAQRILAERKAAKAPLN